MPKAVALACLLLGAALGSAALAADEPLDGLAAALDDAGASAKSGGATVEKLARFVATSAADLRARQVQSGLPWGDFFLAQRVATRGGHPVEKVYAARKTGASWREIAEEARVGEDDLLQDLRAVLPERPAEEKKPASLKDRFLGIFRGTPGGDAPAPPADDPHSAREEIRERILRGGGRGR